MSSWKLPTTERRPRIAKIKSLTNQIKLVFTNHEVFEVQVGIPTHLISDPQATVKRIENIYSGILDSESGKENMPGSTTTFFEKALTLKSDGVSGLHVCYVFVVKGSINVSNHLCSKPLVFGKARYDFHSKARMIISAIVTCKKPSELTPQMVIRALPAEISIDKILTRAFVRIYSISRSNCFITNSL